MLGRFWDELSRLVINLIKPCHISSTGSWAFSSSHMQQSPISRNWNSGDSAFSFHAEQSREGGLQTEARRHTLSERSASDNVSVLLPHVIHDTNGELHIRYDTQPEDTDHETTPRLYSLTPPVCVFIACIHSQKSSLLKLPTHTHSLSLSQLFVEILTMSITLIEMTSLTQKQLSNSEPRYVSPQWKWARRILKASGKYTPGSNRWTITCTWRMKILYMGEMAPFIQVKNMRTERKLSRGDSVYCVYDKRLRQLWRIIKHKMRHLRKIKSYQI